MTTSTLNNYLSDLKASIDTNNGTLISNGNSEKGYLGSNLDDTFNWVSSGYSDGLVYFPTKDAKNQSAWKTTYDGDLNSDGKVDLADRLVFGFYGIDNFMFPPSNLILFGGNGDDVYILNDSSEGIAIVEDKDQGNDVIAIGYSSELPKTPEEIQFLPSYTTASDSTKKLLLAAGTYVEDLYYDGSLFKGNSDYVPDAFKDRIYKVQDLIGTTTDFFEGNILNNEMVVADGSGSVVFRGNDGNDTLRGGNDDDILIGGKGNDYLEGKSNEEWGIDYLIGGDGNDTLDGGNGNDLLIDKVSKDFFTNSDTYKNLFDLDNSGNGGGKNTFYGGNGNDTLYGGDNGDTLNGGFDDDILIGSIGNDLLNGDEGNDTLGGAEGNDTLNGGDGSDLLDGAIGNDLLNGGTGNDTIVGDLGNDTINGGDGDDIISGSNGNDFIDGGAGRNTAIYNGNISDYTISKNDSNYFLSGTDGNDTLKNIQFLIFENDVDTTTITIDSVIGNLKNATPISVNATKGILLKGGLYNSPDKLEGTIRSDTLMGLDGDDTLIGGSGNDFLYSDDDIVYANTSEDKGTTNYLYGANGDDYLMGAAGNDFIEGGDGNDTLSGGNPGDEYTQDTIDGGTGTNTASFPFSQSIYRLFSSTDAPKEIKAALIKAEYPYAVMALAGYHQTILLKNIQSLEFEDGTVSLESMLNGSSLNNTTPSNLPTTGNETIIQSISNINLVGSSGKDTLFGNAGDDILDGRAGNDSLSGNDGSDTLMGGLGKDVLTGGLGADVFKFTNVKDSGITTTARDKISDFKSSQKDKIDLSGIDANEKLAGDQAFKFINAADFSKTDATGQLRFDSKALVLYGSTNADNKPEFSVTLSGVKNLVVDDLIL